MESFGIDNNPLWDLSQATSFSQIADDDFLALLQKQFPTGNVATNYDYTDGINPQNISRYSLPSLSPPSDDSSPSPIGDGGSDGGGDPVLKRKASDEDFEEGPSQKSQHTCEYCPRSGYTYLRLRSPSELKKIVFSVPPQIFRRCNCGTSKLFPQPNFIHPNDVITAKG